MYSAEWSQVVKNYEAYKESLSVFRKYINVSSMNYNYL